MVLTARKGKMTKRISISVPDLTHEKLQRWADIEGTSLSDLAAYILRREIEIAEREGKLVQPTIDERQSETSKSQTDN